jgi:hypothetical protein
MGSDVLYLSDEPWLLAWTGYLLPWFCQQSFMVQPGKGKRYDPIQDLCHSRRDIIL